MGKQYGFIYDKFEHDQQKIAIKSQCPTVDDIIYYSEGKHPNTRESHQSAILDKLNPGDTIIMTDLASLGKSLGNIIQFLDKLLNQNCNLICLNQKLKISENSNFKDIIGILNSVYAQIIEEKNSKIKQSIKKGNKQVGRPSGVGNSKFDEHYDYVKSARDKGVTYKRISKDLNIPYTGLIQWAKRRGIN